MTKSLLFPISIKESMKYFSVTLFEHLIIFILDSELIITPEFRKLELQN